MDQAPGDYHLLVHHPAMEATPLVLLLKMLEVI